MLSVLLRIEKRTIPPLDNALLGTVAEACQTIGFQFITALEGEQREIFQDLCAYITKENINRADQLLSVSNLPYSGIRSLIMLSMGLGAVSRWAVPRVYGYRRRIVTTFRPVSPRALYARIRSTRVARALPARSSRAKQVGIAEDRKENNSHDPPNPFLQPTPAFAPLSLDDLRRTEPLTKSEGGSHTALDLGDPPFTAKRKVSLEEDEKSTVYLHPSKKIKSGLSLPDSV